MRVGVYQFAAGNDIQSNFNVIRRAVASASAQQVRLLVFQECALTGYPTTTPAEQLDFAAVDSYLNVACRLAAENNMYIALGTARRQGASRYNSIVLMTPEGTVAGVYDKRALWGWDLDNFEPGTDGGIFQVDGITIGFRLCYEVRFPEYFRELYMAGAELCFVSFDDVSEEENRARYELIKAHLRTRAVENIMTLVSVNSAAAFQSAPTAVFNIEGLMEAEAPLNTEYLLTYDYIKPELGFSATGRKYHNGILLGTQ